jgi:hypothetical protein
LEALSTEIIDSSGILGGVLLVKRGICVNKNIIKKFFDRGCIQNVGGASKNMSVFADHHPMMQISPDEWVCSFRECILGCHCDPPM